MSEFQNKRPDSPKGKVWTMYQKKGEKAARKLGESLEIPNAKLNRWFKDEGAGFQGINDKIRARKEDGPAPKKNGKVPAKKAAAKKVVPAKKAAKPATKPVTRRRKVVEEEAQEAA